MFQHRNEDIDLERGLYTCPLFTKCNAILGIGEDNLKDFPDSVDRALGNVP